MKKVRHFYFKYLTRVKRGTMMPWTKQYQFTHQQQSLRKNLSERTANIKLKKTETRIIFRA